MIPNEWRKSSECNGASSCVEVACVDGRVLVRDSKLGDNSPVLSWSALEWTLFVDALRYGQLGTYGGPVVLFGVGEAWRMWRDGAYDVALEFSQAEIDAFTKGAIGGEFSVEALAAVVASDGVGPERPPASRLADFGADSAPV